METKEIYEKVMHFPRSSSLQVAPKDMKRKSAKKVKLWD
jgi:hypothetical protein